MDDLGYMVVGIRPSHNGDGSVLVGSAGSAGSTLEAAKNHKAYCEMRSDDEGWHVDRYAIVQLVEVADIEPQTEEG